MARQKASAEFKSFVKGIITEASPLNFPDNASIDEDNFVLNLDGTRQRRLGMDVEDDYAVIDTGESADSIAPIAFSSYDWKNAGGDPDRRICAVQTGTTISFFDVSAPGSISDGLISQHAGVADKYRRCSYAVVDGLLVIVTGKKQVQIFKYLSGAITVSQDILYIRDQFGVEDVDPATGYDLNQSNNIAFRPAVQIDTHLYNLRNQTWGLQRGCIGIGNNPDNSNVGLGDPILAFKFAMGASLFPSNADSVLTGLYADPGAVPDDPTSVYFHGDVFYKSPIGTDPAPKGYFIIDALERGASRLTELQKNLERNAGLLYPVTALPVDSTPGGAAVVAEFSGRLFYAGFSGEIVGGDNKSPRMSSYVLFSRLIRDPSDVNRCHQSGDPTSREASDILASDGGFVRVDGAFNITGLAALGKSLVVIAENGVWSITGGSDYGFAADNFSVTKITSYGSIASGAVVVVDNSVMYWGPDAIYTIAPDQFGSLKATNLTSNTIQTFYGGIALSEKVLVNGVYDSYERKVHWLYQTQIDSEDVTRELIFDIQLQAFYPATIKSGPAGFPRVYSFAEVPPFAITTSPQQVVVGVDDVVVGAQAVVVTDETLQLGTREVAYVTLLSESPVTFTFSFYRDTTFLDWNTLGVGVDSPAYLITGYISGGDNVHDKQVPYVTFYFERTEDGFQDDGTGNLYPTKQSSCLVQTQWGWANSPNGGKWGRQFQAYRYRRFYMPANSADTFDTGDSVIVTKNKLRGIDKVLSLYITTEPTKDCKLLGWSMDFGINNAT